MPISIELSEGLKKMYPKLRVEHVRKPVDKYDPRTGRLLPKKRVIQHAKLVCGVTDKGCGPNDASKQLYQSEMFKSVVTITNYITAPEPTCYVCPVYKNCENGKN